MRQAVSGENDVFGERPIEDLLGEALRRHRHGSIRPFWKDMPEGDQKRAWRRLGMRLLEPNAVVNDSIASAHGTSLAT